MTTKKKPSKFSKKIFCMWDGVIWMLVAGLYAFDLVVAGFSSQVIGVMVLVAMFLIGLTRDDD